MKWSLIQTFLLLPSKNRGHFPHVEGISSDLNDICECEECRVTRVFSLLPSRPFYDPDWWPRCLGIRNMQPSEHSGPHARQLVQFSSLRHISLAKNKFLLFFFIILPLISPEMLTFLFAGQAGRELPWRRHYRRATDYRREGGYKSISPSLNTLHFRLVPHCE